VKFIAADDLQALLRQFRLERDDYAYLRAEELLDGHINTTYLLETAQAGTPRRYISIPMCSAARWS
jgi:hypothetical protein